MAPGAPSALPGILDTQVRNAPFFISVRSAKYSWHACPSCTGSPQAPCSAPKATALSALLLWAPGFTCMHCCGGLDLCLHLPHVPHTPSTLATEKMPQTPPLPCPNTHVVNWHYHQNHSSQPRFSQSINLCSQCATWQHPALHLDLSKQVRGSKPTHLTNSVKSHKSLTNVVRLSNKQHAMQRTNRSGG